MAELIEYLIAFGVSAGMAGAALAFFHGALPGVRLIASQSEADQIASAARIAAIEGREVQVTLPLSRSSIIACSSGTLTVSLDNSTFVTVVDFPCSFSVQDLGGMCTLTFSGMGPSLSLRTSC